MFREENGEKLFLLLHYPSGHWDLPKGHCEKGETEHETAGRELLEETGISDIEFIEEFRLPISYTYRRNKKLSNKQVVFFLGKSSSKDVKLSFEHQNFVWLPYEKSLDKLTFDNAKNLLKKAKIFLEK